MSINLELSHGKYQYDNNFPQDLAKIVKPLLKDLEWLVPSWAQYAIVKYETTDAENLAGCRINYGNRFIVIGIYPSFFETDADERKETLYHEMIHSFGKVFADYARKIIRELLTEHESDFVLNQIMDELDERNEAWTQDLAYALRNKLK